MTADEAEHPEDASDEADSLEDLEDEDCPVSGEVYSAAGGTVARFFVGRTPGYYNPELTVEDVAENFDQIRDETGYKVLNDANHEVGVAYKTIRAAQE